LNDFYKGFHPQVEDVKQNAERESGERILGTDPKTGRQVSVRLGKFGPMVQIGTVDDEEKPLFASLSPDQQLTAITYEEAMDLFQLPKDLGVYQGEDIVVNNGRFGPYVKFGKKYVSLPKGKDPLTVELEDAIILIKEKEKADAPIYEYQGLPVQKGKGRFGPFIKWNNMFINVNKKYDWDNLSDNDIITLIEDKIQKEKDKLIHVWDEEGIRVEKARWGRHNVIKGKTKIELPKTVDVSKFTLEEVQAIIEKNAPKKKTTKRKTTAKKK
jgi:DNA topoisomerase-1